MMIDTNLSLTSANFNYLAKIIHEDSGIVLTQAKQGLLMARLNRRLRQLGLSNYQAYCALLDSPDGKEERRKILSAITTNVTAFFREAHHFDALGQHVLPPLIDLARKGGRVRLWSAACSSGEEAYSIAMSVMDNFPDVDRYDLLILATDIDPVVVAKAEAGIYPKAALMGLDVEKREKYFTETENSFDVCASLRKFMRFSELNLHDEWPFSGQFDVIFCRNVVIYFDTNARQQLWQRFSKRLTPNGHLFIGHSERLDGPASNAFRLVGATHYAKAVIPLQP